MRKKGLPRTCRFCADGNGCPTQIEALEKEFPEQRDGFIIPIPEYDAMGAKLALRFLCYEKIYTGEKK